jgi:hypothetical protein
LLIIKYVLTIEHIEYLWLFAIHGYSYTIFVLTTALNIVPLEWLRWTLLGVSALVCLSVMISELHRNLKENLKGPNMSKFIMLIAFLVFTQGVLILSLKRYFLA